jgi:fibronectin-binding autotransporter adhesin
LWRDGVPLLFMHSKIVFDQIKLFKVAVCLRAILRFSFTNKAISSGITMTAPGFTSRFFRSTALSDAQLEQSTDIKSKKSVRKKSPIQFSSLEPRVLFDAAAERTAAAIADAAFIEHGEITDPMFHDLLVALDASVAVPVDVLPWHEQPAVENLNAAVQEIVFIDSGVEDPAAIAASAPGGAAIVYLQSGRDGLDQIAAYLSGRTDVSAIHIVSHGEEGDLILGGSKVDATALALHSADLAVIKSALAEHGDILLYGCDVAKGSNRFSRSGWELGAGKSRWRD